MTREEAIKILHDCKAYGFRYTQYNLVEYHEAIEMAISALQTKPCEDAVSRKQAIDEIRRWFDLIKLNPDILIDAIVTLPSVTPQVIRCKDCKHFKGKIVCEWHAGFYPDAEYFCADAEAKMEIEE